MNYIARAWDVTLDARAAEAAPLIQILIGPRQVGKTTSLRRLAENEGKRAIYGSADDRQIEDSIWIERLWEQARSHPDPRPLLILDEIQKINNWSETIKRLWDEDVRSKNQFRVILSGSSSLTLQTGLTESLAGRFEIIPATHLNWPEFSAICQGTLEQFVFFGAYPGALRFLDDEQRWRDFINQSIIESIISKDILLMTRVDKPALLRRLFQLGCEYSGQILSFQKSVGMLQDAGNTTTLAHYLNLLDQAFVLRGIQKFELRKQRLRSSSPKYQVHNTALMGAQGPFNFRQTLEDREIWGRYLESAIGAHLVNWSRIRGFELTYWRDGNFEVDFVLRYYQKITAIEVKSGRRGKISGLSAFKKRVPQAKPFVVGEDPEDLKRFLATDPLEYFSLY
jgi:predicted AAA+ superfamily ATPase